MLLESKVCLPVPTYLLLCVLELTTMYCKEASAMREIVTVSLNLITMLRKDGSRCDENNSKDGDNHKLKEQSTQGTHIYLKNSLLLI